jgi:hypothetical protein
VDDEDYRLIHLRKKATEFLPSVHYHEVPTVCQANSPGVRRPDARAGPTAERRRSGGDSSHPAVGPGQPPRPAEPLLPLAPALL